MKKLMYILALVIMCFASCSDEKEVVIIKGNLPIKTANFYIVGNATPVGWNIDEPYKIEPTEEDPLIYIYNGPLYEGEMKCPLSTGNWGCNYVMPVTNMIEVNKNGCAESSFDLINGGNPDKKWLITERGIYTVTFDLRNWTINFVYESELQDEPEQPSEEPSEEPSDEPSIEPIETDVLYFVGSATPVDWNIDEPFVLTQSETDPFIFTYDGELKEGEFKCPLTTGNWGCDYVMPKEGNTEISSKGCAERNFTFIPGGNPDNKWLVTEAGNYSLIFNLRDWTIDVIYKAPIETDVLYIVGNGTPAGWNIDEPLMLTKSEENPYIYTYEGPLYEGEMKCPLTTGNWDCDYVMPITENTEINSKGCAVRTFDFIKGGHPDKKWLITEAGNYKLTFDLENWTIDVVYVSAL